MATEPVVETIPHEAHLRSFIEAEVDKLAVVQTDAKVDYPASTVAGLKSSVDEIIKALKEAKLIQS